MKCVGRVILTGVLSFAAGWYLGKRKEVTATYLSGLGASGKPQLGSPKTEAERAETHKGLYGEGALPLRGTGITRKL